MTKLIYALAVLTILATAFDVRATEQELLTSDQWKALSRHDKLIKVQGASRSFDRDCIRKYSPITISGWVENRYQDIDKAAETMTPKLPEGFKITKNPSVMIVDVLMSVCWLK